MGRPSITAHPLLSIREFVLEKNPVDMVNVGEPSAKPLPLINISKLTPLVRNPGDVKHVGKALVDVLPFLPIREFVLE